MNRKDGQKDGGRKMPPFPPLPPVEIRLPAADKCPQMEQEQTELTERERSLFSASFPERERGSS